MEEWKVCGPQTPVAPFAVWRCREFGDADGPAKQRKYRESKTEASAAQNNLEKEITTLRDTSRTLQLRLRDIEVANDDFERQARNTTSSLEDLESKYNVSIERGVMMEEEIKMGEQERESLRVEAQRLREELSDLKIEAEILQDKIKKQEARHLSAISTDISVPDSPTFDNSPNSTASSPLITTPPDTKLPEAAGRVHDDPPSPPHVGRFSPRQGGDGGQDAVGDAAAQDALAIPGPQRHAQAKAVHGLGVFPAAGLPRRHHHQRRADTGPAAGGVADDARHVAQDPPVDIPLSHPLPHGADAAARG